MRDNRKGAVDQGQPACRGERIGDTDRRDEKRRQPLPEPGSADVVELRIPEGEGGEGQRGPPDQPSQRAPVARGQAAPELVAGPPTQGEGAAGAQFRSWKSLQTLAKGPQVPAERTAGGAGRCVRIVIGFGGAPREEGVHQPFPVVFAGLGVELSEMRLFEGEQQRLLTALFGVFLLCAAGFNLKRVIRPSATIRDEAPSETAVPFWKAILFVGAPTGLLSGLLGVGGGIIAVPAQQIFLRVGLRQAIGNSAATICGLSLVGALTKNYHWWASHDGDPFAPLTIALFVVPGAVLGGLIGGRLTHVLPKRWIGGSLAVVLVIAGVRQVSYGLVS